MRSIARRMRAAICALVWVLMSLPWGTVLAQEANAQEANAQEANAQQLAAEGQRAYREGRFEESADLFAQAYALAHAPSLLYNQARALENAGRVDEAAMAYQRYLEEDAAAPDRAGITERIRRLDEARIERERLAQRAAERDALEAALRAQVARGEIPATETPTVVARAPSPIPWVLFGVGLAGLGAGVGVGVWSNDRYQVALVARTQEETLQAAQQANDLALAANVLFATAGTLALVGLVWGIVDVVEGASPTESALRTGTLRF